MTFLENYDFGSSTGYKTQGINAEKNIDKIPKNNNKLVFNIYFLF